MTMHSRSGGVSSGLANLRRRGCLGLAVVAGLCFVTLNSVAASHPVHPAHDSTSHRRSVQDVPEIGARKSLRAGKKATAKAKSAMKGAGHSTKSATTTKHHKQRQPRHPAREADSDPIPMYRASTKSGTGANWAQRAADRTRSAPVLKAERLERIHPSERGTPPNMPTGMAAGVSKTSTSGNFSRGAGGTSNLAAKVPHVYTAGEELEYGVSHPDDDERVPINRVWQASGPPTVAVVSAAAEPTTPVGKASLPDQLNAAAANVGHVFSGQGRAKQSVLPEDHAAKVEVIEQAMTPVILPTLYMRNGRVLMPPPMRGSHDILVHQNFMANSEGLERIRDNDDLDRMRGLHLLVPLIGSASLLVNAELPRNRRYARPWAARFASDVGRAFYGRFHQPLRLNSAVRTVQYQIRLQRVNGNAAAADGDGASPHLTGQALDFGKRGMSATQIAWMRSYLAPLMQAGRIDVEEEFQQACFHVSVYRSYAPVTNGKAAAKIEVAQAGDVKAPATALKAVAAFQ